MDFTIEPLLTDPAAWAALISLVVMEVVLGIDNLIFIAILTNKLPEENRVMARRIGIGGALILRLLLLAAPLLTLEDYERAARERLGAADVRRVAGLTGGPDRPRSAGHPQHNDPGKDLA